jgi:hypothetical protein
MKRFLLIAMILLFAAAGCNRYDIDELLLKKEDISLTIKGEEYFSYKSETCQLGYNPQKNEFRVFDDNAGDWFRLTCSASPDTEEQTIKADLEYTTSDDNKILKGIEFTVKKTSKDGKIWLWNDPRKIGVVVTSL